MSYSGAFGGAERVLLDVAMGLPEPPLIACPAGALADAARGRGLGVFELRERSLELRRSARDRVAMPLRIAAQAGEVRAIVAGQRPDALLAWGMRAGLVLAAAYPPARGRPRWLLQHHDLLPGPLIARAVRAAAARADVVTACSRCVAVELDPTGKLDVQLVPLGVDLERFRPANPRTERPEALVLGAIERWKRPDLALEAVALAARRVPDLRVRLLGAPIGADGKALLAELRARAERPDLAGRVEIAGSIADPREVLSRAGCLLHCADREPYGMVVVEALASGLPVVAPASCGPAEIVDEHCAVLYEPGDPAAAARALERVIAHDQTAARMASAARSRAEERFSLEGTRRRYAELLEALTGSSRAGAAPRTRVLRPRAGESLAIVTVIHQSEAALAALLRSIERHLPAAQVVVVDSGSTDGGLALAQAWRSGAATVVDLGENAGFGRGTNAGLARVDRPVTAILNPDVELLDSSLEAAVAELTSRPGQIIAPRVLRADDTLEDNAQRAPGTAPLVVHALAPGAALPARIAAAVEPWRGGAAREVGWAVGCAIVAKTDTLRRLGPFDERTFMYGEDLDLGLRTTDAQTKTVFWPAARVLHHGAHSTLQAFAGEPIQLLAERRQAVVAERRGRGRATVDRVLQRLTFRSRMLLKSIAGVDATRERRQLEARDRV